MVFSEKKSADSTNGRMALKACLSKACAASMGWPGAVFTRCCGGDWLFYPFKKLSDPNCFVKHHGMFYDNKKTIVTRG